MLFLKNSVGVYIGPRTIQIAHLKSVGKKIRLENFVHVDIFEGEQSTEDHDQQDKQALVLKALQKAVHKSNIDLRKVNTVLMPGTVLLRYFQMPRISSEEMEEAVRFESRKYIPFRLEEAVTGFYILNSNKDDRKIGVLSLVAKEETIKDHLGLLGKADINPVSVETASFAIMRLLEHAGEVDKKSSNIVMYIYAQRLNMIILKEGVPMFIRDVSLSKKEEWIDDETAEMLFQEYGESVDSRISVLDNALNELQISLEYYRKELGKEDVTKAILCGDLEDFDDLNTVQEAGKEFPDIPPLAAFFAKRLKIEVTTVDPLKEVFSPKAKPLPYTFPMLPVTIGAALKGLTPSMVEIDLFKARKKTSLRVKRFIRKMVLVETAALCVCMFIMFLVFGALVNREKNLLMQEKRKSPKFMDLSHFSESKLKQGGQEIDKLMGLHNRLMKERNYLTHKLSQLPKQMPENIWLKKLNYANPLPTEKGRNTGLEMVLSGYVYTEQKGMEVELINNFSDALKNDPKYFRGFRVIKTGQVSNEIYQKIPVMSFSLDCLEEVRD